MHLRRHICCTVRDWQRPQPRRLTGHEGLTTHLCLATRLDTQQDHHSGNAGQASCACATMVPACSCMMASAAYTRSSPRSAPRTPSGHVRCTARSTGSQRQSVVKASPRTACTCGRPLRQCSTRVTVKLQRMSSPALGLKPDLTAQPAVAALTGPAASTHASSRRQEPPCRLSAFSSRMPAPQALSRASVPSRCAAVCTAGSAAQSAVSKPSSGMHPAGSERSCACLCLRFHALHRICRAPPTPAVGAHHGHAARCAMQVIKAHLMHETQGSMGLPHAVLEQLIEASTDADTLSETAAVLAEESRTVVWEGDTFAVLDTQDGDAGTWHRCRHSAAPPAACRAGCCTLIFVACDVARFAPQMPNIGPTSPKSSVKSSSVEMGCVLCSVHARCEQCPCRDLVHKASPHFTQSKIQLAPHPSQPGARVPDHARLPPDPAVFQALAAAVPLCQRLRSQVAGSPPCGRIAVVGAGACAIPSVLAQQHPHLTIDAVDISTGAHVLSIFASTGQCRFTCVRAAICLLSHCGRRG